ncbi:MAG: hypothetical protein IJ047_02005 [Paludibacteraceae bacterium]|nr:hypothetical protein [Paludibacteraceae bacterium]
MINDEITSYCIAREAHGAAIRNLTPPLFQEEGGKCLRNGQVYIKHKGQMYNVQGKQINYESNQIILFYGSSNARCLCSSK